MTRTALASFCLTAFLLSPTAFARDRSISGFIVDTEEQGVDASVEVVRGNERRTTKADPDGWYSIRISEGGPIDSLTFRKPGYFPATFEKLSGSRDHTINKILLQKGKVGALSDAEVVSAVSDLEVIALVEERFKFRTAEGEAYHEAFGYDEVREALAGRIMQIQDEGLRRRLQEGLDTTGARYRAIFLDIRDQPPGRPLLTPPLPPRVP